jgi:prepilin-type N-terminal cleavage/methylation domain-containing protein
MLSKVNAQRGDTLIEVLFAVTIFSMIVVGALALMNQGTSASRRSLETTIARQAMDAQAETLRFMHESYVTNYQSGASYSGAALATPAGQYSLIVANARDHPKTAGSSLNVGDTACPASPPQYSFIVNPANANVVLNTSMIRATDTYPQLVYNSGGGLTESRGIWVEAVRPTDTIANSGAIDFHIRTCWISLASNVAVTLGTIVRGYEQRG